MKKLLALLLVGVMAFSAVACGNNNAPAEQPTEEVKEEVKEEPAETETPEEVASDNGGQLPKLLSGLIPSENGEMRLRLRNLRMVSQRRQVLR